MSDRSSAEVKTETKNESFEILESAFNSLKEIKEDQNKFAARLDNLENKNAEAQPQKTRVVGSHPDEYRKAKQKIDRYMQHTGEEMLRRLENVDEIKRIAPVLREAILHVENINRKRKAEGRSDFLKPEIPVIKIYNLLKTGAKERVCSRKSVNECQEIMADLGWKFVETKDAKGKKHCCYQYEG
ncbi:MAG: hypothetical protein F6K54_00260 [Okeania sp. SIO3B5]|uniref:hypothetical protein n=1 Tax=Okeania sp. SIO3B5 TaxID=2607811 RepID=UPI001400EF9C|nr:hypothetical protein [Okeania sp. SIO3B5]NEO51667.1 hypothetical protein [Okeania sp. SIO3B5]